jgi:murein DD-endopeptidase MepM/ murein hydrolase activator NlpD
MQTLYGHNEKLYVETGQYVDQGQTIAWMGRSGRVYGPTGIHVHFEVRINGVKYNPMNFF